MNPFYFGSSKRPLFGIHHAPKSDTVRQSGVVLCPAIGQDYMRTHRGLKQLAQQLSKAGFHVLRFDYFGTGDSGGETAEADLDQWLSDVADAVDELKDTAGVQRVTLGGIRLGAALAAMAAATRSDIDRVILWDPVVRGAAYLRDLDQLGEPPSTNGGMPRDTVGVSGFPLTPTLRDGFGRIDLLQSSAGPADRLLLVVSEQRPEYRELEAHLSRTAPRSIFRLVPTAADWDDVDRLGAVLLPQGIIKEIMTYMNDHE